MLVTKPLSVIVSTTTDAKEECRWVSLTSYLAVGNARKSTRISLIDTNKEIRPRATLIKRFLSGMVRCHTPGVPPDEFAQAAQEALGKLSPEERAAFVKMLQERAAERGVKLPREVASDPKDLGQVLTDLHEKPGQLRDILGGILSRPRRPRPCSGPLRPWWSDASCRVRLEPRSASARYASRPRHVRSPPQSGHSSARAAGPLSANS